MTVTVLAVTLGETQKCDRDWVFITVKEKLEKVCTMNLHPFEKFHRITSEEN